MPSILDTSNTFCDLNPHLGDYGDDLLYGLDAVNSSIENILGCAPGSRWWRPQLGSYLQKYLFYPFSVTTAAQIQHEVVTVLGSIDPRVRILSVNVTADQPNRIYALQVYWNVATSGTSGVFQANLSTTS